MNNREKMEKNGKWKMENGKWKMDEPLGELTA